MNSKFFSINSKDVLKGVLVAFLTVFVTSVGQSISNGAIPTAAELKVAALSGLGAGLAYLMKNLLTNSNGEVAKSEPVIN